MEIPFIGQAYESDSAFISAQRCVNWYLETSPENGRTPAALFPTPGMSTFCTLGAPSKALRVVDGRLFSVSAGTLEEIARDGARTARGSVTNTGYARLIDNGLQLLVLTGSGAFSLQLDTNVLTSISNANLAQSKHAVVIDGYGVFLEEGTQRVRVTSPYDFTAVDGLDFASAEGLPDNAVTLAALNRELWIFGERSTEIWFDSGDANFPFQRNSNTFLEFGCASARSVCKLDGSLYWIGRASDGRSSCFRANGYQPEIIAHHGIAKHLEAADRAGGLSQAWAYTYHERGHPFYVLTLPSINKTFAYDPLSGTWHERSFYSSLSVDKYHPALDAVTFEGRTVVAVESTPLLADLSESTLTDFGGPIVRTRVCPAIHAGQKRLVISCFELLLQSGIGREDGLNPVVKMRQSRDGGQSFDGWRTETAGAIGRTDRRVSFRRLGEAINRVIEVQVSDPVKWVVLGATVDAKAVRRG